MVAVPPSERHRPRRGSLERPVNGRLYRGTWLLVGFPLLLAAFSVARPGAVAPPTVPAAFDRAAAAQLAGDLAGSYPSRFPGSAGATGAERWFAAQLAPYGLRTRAERFSATVAGYGTLPFTNLIAVAPGRSPQSILVMAHRDDLGQSPGANDNASGTAALIELARAYGTPPVATTGAARTPPISPTYTIIFLSSDGGALGGVGAAEFASRSPERKGVVAVLNLDTIGGAGAPRLELAGDTPRLAVPTFVETVASRIQQEAGVAPGRPSALRQLLDLALPFSLYEQAPFLAHGVSAVTITSASDRPLPSAGDVPGRLDSLRMAELGRAAQDTIAALDQGVGATGGTSSYLFLGPQIVRGWAIELVLVAMLLPFFAAAVDLFARCRRRRIVLGPALRSYRSRLGVWLWIAAVFAILGLLGAWPGGVPRPPAPEARAASHWPALPLTALAIAGVLGWLVARGRLTPRRQATLEEQLAGQTVALLALGLVSLVVLVINPFTLLFFLPSLHAWLWLPQVRDRPAWLRAVVVLIGFGGPALALASFAGRYGLGLNAPWYLLELTALGYVPVALALVSLGWLAASAQVLALAAGRYAAYPDRAERGPRGPLREVVRQVVLALRRRRRASELERRALQG